MPLFVTRWTPASKLSAAIAVATIAALSLLPLFFGANVTERLTTLFVYVILAVMWNALAGYAGLVSIGQQVFFGLGAYFAVRMAHAGAPVYLSLVLAGAATGLFACPLSYFILRLREGEFAIGMWVVAELCHLLVNLDSVIQGETGT